MKQKLLLLCAVFFGVLAFVLTYRQIQKEKEAIRGEAETVFLIQVTRDMAPNEKIKERDIMRLEQPRLRSQIISRDEIPWSQKNNIIGRELEFSVNAGKPLSWSDLKSSQRPRGLNDRIATGMRAVTIPVDAISSVANLIQPDDNVDVIGTFRFPEMRGDSSLDTVTQTLLQNVKVLAIGNMWNAEMVNQPGNRSSYSSVTLQVTPAEAEYLIFSYQRGKLTLSLRNFEETKFSDNLQSVDFRFLKENVTNYLQNRKLMQQGRQQ